MFQRQRPLRWGYGLAWVSTITRRGYVDQHSRETEIDSCTEEGRGNGQAADLHKELGRLAMLNL